MRYVTLFSALLLTACLHAPSLAPTAKLSLQHIPASIARQPVPTPSLPAENTPEAPVGPEYSVDVKRVSAEALLTAIARDNRIDFDFDARPDADGLVTLSAYNQPLSVLFDRICDQAALRCAFDGKRLEVMPDTPYLDSYRVDYVNISRETSGSVATSTQIATGHESDKSAMGAAGNASLTHINTKSANNFWESLESNIRALLKGYEANVRRPQCDALAQHGEVNAATCATTTADKSFVVANRETGILMVLANSGQHRQVKEFIDLVQSSANHQVMVEATIVEVSLSDGYKQGIDWSKLGGKAVSIATRGASDGTSLVPTISYLSDKFDVRLEWLETFGTVKVLSSPRLSVLNNQTAMLKVVEEVVYFQVDATTTEYAGNSDREKTTATTRPQSVSVGLVMALTPQIGRKGEIILSVRPTISSISGFKDDPNPSLGKIANRVPQIRTREIESVLRLANGEIAVLGGLMEDKLDYDTGRIPVLGKVPVMGQLFTKRQNSIRRTELVIFLRPRVIKNPSIKGGYISQRTSLPGPNFLQKSPTPGEHNYPKDSAPLTNTHIISPAWSKP